MNALRYVHIENNKNKVNCSLNFFYLFFFSLNVDQRSRARSPAYQVNFAQQQTA